jgi:hypothetical protein
MTSAQPLIPLVHVRVTLRRPLDRVRRLVAEMMVAAAQTPPGQDEPRLLLGPNGGPIWTRSRQD